ncbi:MAG: hypothetical protein KAT06_00915 [Gammaproteobacteria bacterium]|nr:hypothetical protein [Gammaproteobacteria bacterium]
MFPEKEHILISGIADWEKEISDDISKQVGKHSNFSYLESSKKDFALVCHADALVVNDTGLRNLGIAAYTPTVCFFPVAHNAFRYQPRFGNHEVVMADDNGPASVEKAEQALHTVLNK